MTGSELSYDAFISYSHALDDRLAPTLQQEIQRFAKPWYRLRALRVFRDDASLSADPGLWSAIEKALENSRWFVLMASPDAAQSRWVNSEVSWWLENRSVQQLLIVVTNGEFVWDGQSDILDLEETTTIPPALKGALIEEPRWVDLRWLRNIEHVDRANPRLRECIADIASAIHGRPKDALIGEHIRQHRKAMRLARSAIATLVTLFVVALIAAGIAVIQRNEAVSQARIATARQLAANAVANLNTRVDLAQLFAAEAYRMDQSPVTRSALFQAVAASPSLVRARPIGTSVTKLAGATKAPVAVAGTASGRLVRWDAERNTLSEVPLSNRPILDVSITADGGKVIATDGEQAMLWNVAAGEQPRPVGDKEAQLVAVSPSGRLMATLSYSSDTSTSSPEADAVLTIIDGQTGQPLRARKTEIRAQISLPDDSTAVLTGGPGMWLRLSTGTLKETDRLDYPITPAGNFLPGSSPNGSYVGFIKYNNVRATETTTAVADFDLYDAETLTAEVPVAQPEHLTISNDGTWVAAAGGGAFSVANLRHQGTDALHQLTGTGRIEAVTFFGEDQQVISAAEGVLSQWNLRQQSRLNPSGLTVDMPSSPNALEPPRIATTPDSSRVAVTSGSGLDDPSAGIVGPAVHNLTGPAVQSSPLVGDYYDALPLWTTDGSRLLLISTGGATDVAVDSKVIERWPPASTARILAGQISQDGSRLVLLDEHGGVQVRNPRDGHVIFTTQGTLEEGATGSSDHNLAAVNATTNRAAVILRGTNTNRGPVVVIDTNTGQSRELPGGPADAVTFGPNNLLVQRDGTLEVWDGHGQTILRTFTGDVGYVGAAAVIPNTDLIARLRGDGTVVISNIDSGDVLGTIQLPPMSRSLVATPWLVTTLAATWNTRELVTATAGGQLVRWQLADDSWLRIACDTAGRDLTADEWREYVNADPPDNLACRRE